MKKTTFLIFCLSILLFLTSCTSLIFSTLGPANGYGFTSFSSDPAYGYEKFPWGTSYETIKEKTGWYISSARGGTYFVGTDGNYWPHGDKDLYVDKTLFYFDIEPLFSADGRCTGTASRLYGAEDEFKKTPAIGFLHNRYGDFSERNLVTSKQRAQGIQTVYRGQHYLDSENFYALEIIIYEKGTTTIKLHEPFYEKSASEKNPQNNWGCYSALDAPNKRINFTFLNQNNEGKYLFIGYSKGYESSNISYIRSGICWGKDANGAYDIKGDSGVLSKNYSTETWNCAFNGNEYSYTITPGESAREILSLFLASEGVSVRHNSTVSEFESSSKQLQDKMSEYGITWKEIDAALLNEEF